MNKIVMTKQDFADLVYAKAAQESIESVVEVVNKMVANNDFNAEVFIPVLLGVYGVLTDSFNAEVAKYIDEESVFAIEDIVIKDE